MAALRKPWSLRRRSPFFVAPRTDTDPAVFLPVVVTLLATDRRRNDGHPWSRWSGSFRPSSTPTATTVSNGPRAGVAPSSNGLLRPVAGLLQPGLWAALLLVGPVPYRVAGAATHPLDEH